MSTTLEVDIKKREILPIDMLGEINLLVVEDDPFNRLLIKSLLDKFPNINIFEASDGIEAIKLLEENGKIVDMILLDLHMPNMNGYETLLKIKEVSDYNHIAILIVTTDEEEKGRLYDNGADGFISKPFRLEELEEKIYMNLSIEEIDEDINYKIKDNKEEITYHCKKLELSQKDFFCNLFKLKTKSKKSQKMEAKRVATIAKEFALRLGYTDNEADNIYCAAKTRDIGLMGLNQKRPNYVFSTEDKENYQDHILLGYEMVDSALETNFTRTIKKVILEYRESYNGYGIPNGIKGDTISEEAMIVAMAETFEALLTRRFYRSQEKYTVEETYEIFRQERGKRFNPRLTKIFLEHFSELIEIRQSLVSKYN